MDDFTVRKQELKALFNQGRYQEVIDNATKYISELDPEDFTVHNQISSCYKIMSDCYFRLSDKARCEEILMKWPPFAVDDDELYKIFFARIRLDVVTDSVTDKTLQLIDQSIGRYKELDRARTVADLLVWKGIAMKSAKYLKEAVGIYDECEENTDEDKAFALKKIKELRNLYEYIR